MCVAVNPRTEHASLCPQLADAAKLKPLEMQLKKLEDLSEAIVQNFAYMREREEQMRDTNGEGKLGLRRLECGRRATSVGAVGESVRGKRGGPP